QIVGALLVGLVKLTKPVLGGFVQIAKGITGVVGPALKWLGGVLQSVAQKLGLLTGTKVEMEVKPPKIEPPKMHQSLAPSLTGFEAPEAAYFRIAAASRKVGAGKPVDEQQLDVQEEI